MVHISIDRHDVLVEKYVMSLPVIEKLVYDAQSAKSCLDGIFPGLPARICVHEYFESEPP